MCVSKGNNTGVGRWAWSAVVQVVGGHGLRRYVEHPGETWCGEAHPPIQQYLGKRVMGSAGVFREGTNRGGWWARSTPPTPAIHHTNHAQCRACTKG